MDLNINIIDRDTLEAISTPKGDTNIAQDNIPTKISNTLWWKYDVSYNVPDVKLYVKYMFKDNKPSIQKVVSLKLLNLCLSHLLNAESYEIQLANYSADIHISSSSLVLSTSGYSEKFIDVLSFYIQAFNNIKFGSQCININNSNTLDAILTPKGNSKKRKISDINDTKDKIFLDENLFSNIKKMYKQSLENAIYIPPFRQISTKLENNLLYDSFSSKQQLDILDSISFLDIVTHYNNIKDDIYSANVYSLLQGNILYDDAKLIDQLISSSFINSNTLNISNKTSYIIPEIELKNKDKTAEFIEPIENIKEENSCFSLFIKLGDMNNVRSLENNWLKNLCMTSIIGNIVSEQYFDQLRTKESLGYVAQAFQNKFGLLENPINVYQFVVQSSCKDSLFLKQRTFRFVKEFMEYLKEMTEEDMLKFVDSQIKLLKGEFQNLSEEFSYNYSIIVKYDGLFDLKIKKAEYMSKIKKSDILEYYENYFVLNECYYCVQMDKLIN